MILVVGPLGAGKLDYVKSLGYEDADIAPGVLDERPVINDAQNWIWAENGACQELVARLSRKEVVICREVGSGLIPMDAEETAKRRLVGHVCNCLAQEAVEVVRLICGIPQRIK
ncbi:MAG: bifunctional adenosylcobinamide kinase/adenosylcobinamide-phosphate guanylyltransferase [Firmicutes bacterium]|nr:bifunctional adenosylcobinamide kinase/adenosylcobinamide-phosphate guanylyltransferase [Bacillota bacterium]